MAIEKIGPGLGKYSSTKDLERSLKSLLDQCRIDHVGTLRARVYYDYVHIYPVGPNSRVIEVRDNPDSKLRLRTADPTRVVIGRIDQRDPHNYVVHFQPLDDTAPGAFSSV